MSRITNDVGQVQQAVSETVGDLLRESLALVGYVAWLFYLEPRLAVVFLTGAPLVVYPLVRLGQRARRTTGRSQEELERLSHISAEAFTGHRIVKAFGTEQQEARTVRAGRRAAVPGQHEGHGRRLEPAPGDGAAGRVRRRRGAVVRSRARN